MLYWIVDEIGNPREKKEFASSEEALKYAEDRFGEDATYWEVDEEKKASSKQVLTQCVTKILDSIRKSDLTLELQNVQYFDDGSAMISFNPGADFAKDFVSDKENYQFIRRVPESFDIILFEKITDSELNELIRDFIDFCSK